MKKSTKYLMCVAVLVAATLVLVKTKKSIDELDTVDLDPSDDFMLKFFHNLNKE